MSYQIDTATLVAGMLCLVVAGVVIGSIIGFIVGTVRSTSNRNGAWDEHEAKARHITRGTRPAKFPG